jgi:Repeat of unknown function (DUF346)/FG-GAP-like repeat
MPWHHIPPSSDPRNLDVVCSPTPFFYNVFVVGDFDADGFTELAVSPDAAGSRGNDLWVMKWNIAAGSWQHMAPIPNHPLQADIDCSGDKFPAKFAVVADFDGDGRAEILIAPDASGSRGNDLWVMKYVGTFPQGMWQHMALIPNHPMDADIDCSGDQFPAKFAVVGDFDGDGSDELMIAPNAAGSRGNDLWVMKYVGTFPQGMWQHMAPIPNHPMDADIDCSGDQFPAKFAVVGDFDGDGSDELMIVPDAAGSRGNDLWVMKYVPSKFTPGHWQHMAPIPNHPMDADIDCSGKQFPAKFAVAGDFDNDGRAELMILPDASGSRGNDLWVMKYTGTFPAGKWQHMAPIPNHPMDADIDCSGDQLPAKFAVAADFDRDGADELVVAPDYNSISGPPSFSFLWAMKYFGTFPGGAFDHIEPPESVPDNVDAFLSTTVWSARAALVGAFDNRGPELLVGPDFKDPDFGPTEIFFWALGFDPAFVWAARPVVSWAPNRLDIFGLGVNNDMFHKWWDGISWGPSQADWEWLGGSFKSPPFAVSWAPNRLDIFALGVNNDMLHKWSDGSSWGPSQTDWETLGGIFDAPPKVAAVAAVSWAANRLDIFGFGLIDNDFQMLHKWWDGSSWRPSQTDWEGLGSTFGGNPPAVVSWGPNRLDIFVVVNNAMLHKWWDGTSWQPSQTGWEALGGNFDSPPAAVSWAPNRIDIFCLGVNNDMFHKWWDGTTWRPSQTDWEALGGNFDSPPAAVSWAPNRIDIFGVGVNDDMLHKWWDGISWGPSQTDWETLGGTFNSPPAAVSWAPNRLDIFGCGVHNDLLHKWWDGTTWRPSQIDWETLGGTFNAL